MCVEIQKLGGIGCILAAVVLIVGCAGKPSSKSAHPTQQEVQSDSDRFFDRLEEEERHR